MHFRNFILFICFLFLTSCFSKQRVQKQDGSIEVVQEGTTFAVGSIGKKNKRIATYPSAEFTKMIADFRKKIKRFPNDIYELGYLSIENRLLIERMLSENYNLLKVKQSNADSMIIEYKFQKYSKSEMKKLGKITSKVYSGIYSYYYDGENLTIINKIGLN